MISALEWVPAGVADPSPKKYEFSPAELELIEMMENQNLETTAGSENAVVEVDVVATTNNTAVPKTPASSPQNVPPSSTTKGGKTKASTTTAIANNLPADLRMDEYSSDEDDDDDGARKGTMLGRLLVEGDIDDNEVLQEDNMEEEEEEEEDEAIVDKDSQSGGDDGDDNDYDEFGPIEDTREYMPIDVDGLKAMGLSQVGFSAAPSYMDDLDGDNGLMDGDGDENDSDAEDVQIRPHDDAVLVIAKTEDVSCFTSSLRECTAILFRFSFSVQFSSFLSFSVGLCVIGSPCVRTRYWKSVRAS
jgi:hypothetical protein